MGGCAALCEGRVSCSCVYVCMKRIGHAWCFLPPHRSHHMCIDMRVHLLLCMLLCWWFVRQVASPLLPRSVGLPTPDAKPQSCTAAGFVLGGSGHAASTSHLFVVSFARTNVAVPLPVPVVGWVGVGFAQHHIVTTLPCLNCLVPLPRLTCVCIQHARWARGWSDGWGWKARGRGGR